MTVSEITGLLYAHSYLILFPLVVVEGPIATVVAGFLVSLGFMAFIPAYFTVVTGDLGGDILYYLAGRYLLQSKIFALSKKFGTAPQKIKDAEVAIKKNKGKILFFGKITHTIGAPILIAAGILKIAFKDFFWFNFCATLPKSLTLILIGFFFGHSLNLLSKYFWVASLFLAFITFLVILIYYWTYLKAKKYMGKV